MPKRPAPSGARSTVSGLALHASAEKVEALRKERARLLRDVNKKKQQVAQARAAAEQEAEATWLKMGPLVERHDSLVHELSALFDELLTKGRFAAKARSQVLLVRSALERQGILEPLDSPDEPEASRPPRADAAPSGRRAKSTSGSSRASEKRGTSDAAEGAPRDVASARQPGPERRSLRELFRSLASAVHPDRARQEAERERRTEVMKEVTRAYEAGDLARLIELESAWQSERVLAGDGDPGQRCAELERVNRELLNQVRALTRELRDVKREVREAAVGPLESLIEQAQHELDELVALIDFVRQFRDGNLSLSAFMRGPSRSHGSDEVSVFALDDLFTEEPTTVHPHASRRRRNNGKAR